MSTSRARLELIEARLQDPPADGLLVLEPIGTGSGTNDLLAGDLITACDGARTADEDTLMRGLQAAKTAQRSARLDLIRNATPLTVALPVGRTGIHGCAVRAHVNGWPAISDHQETPLLRPFTTPRQFWFRNFLGDDVAGFELLDLSGKGGNLTLDGIFRIGGPGWEFHVRFRSEHRPDRWLSQTSTTMWQGAPEVERLVGACQLEADGRWRGAWTDDEQRRHLVDEPGDLPHLSGYATTLLAMTIPLQAGAAITTLHMGDGCAVSKARTRLVVEPVRSVTVSGNPTKAWPVRWHHYGTGNPADDERFFFSADGHELVRIEWGPRYGNCISERCDRETALSGLPGNLSTVIPRQPGGATGR